MEKKSAFRGVLAFFPFDKINPLFVKQKTEFFPLSKQNHNCCNEYWVINPSHLEEIAPKIHCTTFPVESSSSGINPSQTLKFYNWLYYYCSYSIFTARAEGF